MKVIYATFDDKMNNLKCVKNEDIQIMNKNYKDNTEKEDKQIVTYPYVSKLEHL
jgi:hypothetical protein